MYYSVCVPAVFRGKKIEDVLPAVRRAGFDYYEFWGWQGVDVDACYAAQQREGLKLRTLCTKAEPLTNPQKRQEYVDGLKATAEICKKMGAKVIITQVGSEQEGMSREAQHVSIVEGLRACVPVLEEHDLVLMIEPLNTKINHPGYYMWSSEEAFQIVDEVGSKHVKVLYDIYHQHITGDLSVEKIVQNLDKIAHFHVAGFPGRHEPLIDSEIDYPTILRAIKECGYQGSVGLEYMPVNDAEEGLKILHEQLLKI